jgi:hypothetical protein
MANDTPDNLQDTWIDTGPHQERPTVNTVTIQVTVKLNTNNLRMALKLFAIPAKIYLGVANLIYKLAGKKTYRLAINVSEDNA